MRPPVDLLDEETTCGQYTDNGGEGSRASFNGVIASRCYMEQCEEGEEALQSRASGSIPHSQGLATPQSPSRILDRMKTGSRQQVGQAKQREGAPEAEVLPHPRGQDNTVPSLPAPSSAGSRLAFSQLGAT